MYAPVSVHPRVLARLVLIQFEQEINNLKMRAQGAALASASNWLCKFYSIKLAAIMTLTNPPSQRNCRDSYTHGVIQHRLEILDHLYVPVPCFAVSQDP